jgi:hypothetical protein
MDLTANPQAGRLADKLDVAFWKSSDKTVGELGRFNSSMRGSCISTGRIQVVIDPIRKVHPETQAF